MRKFILASIMCLFALTAFSQAHRHFKSVYTIVDTLSVKSVQSNYPTRDGDYLITLPKEQNLVVAYNNDHTKAIALHGYPYAKRMEYNVKYEGTRQILWYKDEHIYCGYIYETKIKACQYIEAINEAEKERLEKRFPFIKRMPTFTNKSEE